MAANDDTAVTNEDTRLITNVLVNDREPSGAIPSLVDITDGPANGTASFDADEGTITYVPADDFNGEDSLVYRVVDSAGDQSEATLTITVRPVNDPPVAISDRVTTAEDTPITIPVTANDIDVDGDVLRVTRVEGAQNGTVRVFGGDVTYTPNENWSGSEVLSYTVTDGNATSSAFVFIEVTPVNDAPVATNDTATTDEDVPVVIDVLANDTDVDGDTLSVGGIASGPANGTATVNANGTITYTPNADFNGTDSFDYEVEDGEGGSDVATVNVRVNPVNDAPVAVDDEATILEDARPTVITVLANDTDVDGDRLRVVSVGDEATLGTVAVARKGSGVTYTPNADANGTDTFTYTIADPSGELSTATVTVVIEPVNDAPVANAVTVVTDEDVPLPFSPLLNDTDADGDELTIVEVGEAGLGTVAIADDGETLVYTPNPDANGTDRFTYTISDGELTASSTVTVTVNPVNDAPVAVDDAVTTAEDRPVTINVLANDTDVDGDRLAVDAIVTAPANGTAEIVNNQIVYTPGQDFNGTDSLVYSVADGNGGTAEATVAIEVTPVNDAPVAVADAVETDEDVPVVIDVLDNDTDVDGDALAVTGVGRASFGVVSIAENGQSITYTPNENANGTDSFTYTVSDGELTASSTVTVVVNPVNDAPVANDDTATTREDEAVLINVLANDTDIDGDALSVAGIVGQPANGTLDVDGETGQLRYTPDADFNGSDSFTYEVTDGDLTDTATVAITVTPVNDAPVAVADEAETDEDVPVLIDVLANDTDIDSDVLRVASVDRPTNGTAVVDGETGQILYTPNQDFNGTDSFTYVVTDDEGGSATGTVTVTIAPVNDAPVAVDDTATTEEDTAVLIDVLTNDTDVDGDTLEVLSVGTPTNGTAAIDNSGQILYTPDEDFNGGDSFTYVVTDNEGGTSTATVAVQVTPVNDAPVAFDDEATVLEDGVARIAVLANDTDVDGDRLRVAEVGEAENGTVAISGEDVVYTPNPDFFGSDSFTYVVADPGGLTAEATVAVTVEPVNDAPVAVEDSFTVLTGSSSNSLDILDNDSDIDSAIDPSSVRITSTASNGLLAVSNSGEVNYQPLQGFIGNDSFSYTVADEEGLTSNAARVIISVVAPETPSEESAVALTDVLGDDDIGFGGGSAGGVSAPAAAPEPALDTLVVQSEAA